MVMYPIYNTADNKSDIMLSDIICENTDKFLVGFAIGASLTPGAAFAENLPKAFVEIIQDIPANQTLAGKIAANSVAVGACVKAVACNKEIWAKTVEETAKRSSHPGVKVGVCLLVTGWCVGQITDRAIRRAF